MESLFRPFKCGFGEVPQLLLLLESRGHAFQTARSLATLRKSLWGEHKEAPTEARRPRAKRHPEAANPKESSDPSKPKGTLLKKFWRQFRAQAAPPGVTELQRLRDDDFPRKKRVLPVERTDGSEILFGIAPCSMALATAKRSFSRLFLKAAPGGAAPSIEAFSRQAEDRGIPVEMVRRKVLDQLCHGGVHQGVCLEATPLHPIDWTCRMEGATTEKATQLLWVALEGILDPMNLGAVLRSAHFLGVDGIVMSRKNSCPLTPVVSKASSGAMEVLDVFGADDLPSFLKAKSEEGWEVLGTVAHAKAQEGIPVVSCLDFRWMRPTILVLGNEGHGLSPETKSLCRRMLTIAPGRELEPGIESLNVSVAAGILLHSICAQKTKEGKEK
nr:rRNA methyltransferase 1, mitochondrial [Anolis sagrei ordinatus]